MTPMDDASHAHTVRITSRDPEVDTTGQQILRPARPDDAPAIAEIWRTGWHDAHAGHVPDKLVAARPAESFRTRVTQRIGDATVVEVCGEDVGFVMVVADEVEQVYVVRQHRGAGVAGALMGDAERQISAAGHQAAWLAVIPDNSRARRFYARQGWRDAGAFDYDATGEHGAIPVRCHRYVKDLPGAGVTDPV